MRNHPRIKRIEGFTSKKRDHIEIRNVWGRGWWGNGENSHQKRVFENPCTKIYLSTLGIIDKGYIGTHIGYKGWGTKH
jgi:hypothetical protein